MKTGAPASATVPTPAQPSSALRLQLRARFRTLEIAELYAHLVELSQALYDRNLPGWGPIGQGSFILRSHLRKRGVID